MPRMSGPVAAMPRPMGALTLALAIVVAVSAVAVASEPSPSLPGPASPGASSAPGSSSPTGVVGSPAASPVASAVPAEVLITCGGRDAYRGLGVDAPAGARIQQTPEAAELRRAIRQNPEDLGGASGWRIAGRTDDEVLFLGIDEDVEPPQWAYVVVGLTDAGWELRSWGGCDPRVVISPEIGSADWWPDPAAPPDPETTELHVLVMERSCASGASADGRIAAPVIVTSATSVTITIGVLPREGDQDCRSNPPTPFVVLLPEPLGERQLLDGGHAPPAEPVPPKWLESE